MFNDTFCVHIATDYSVIVGLIQVKPKGSPEYRYYMEINEAILFEEFLERILHPADCTSLDNFIDNSLPNNYIISNVKAHIEITIKGKYDKCKRRFSMRYDTCEALIKAIRRQLNVLKENQVGTCTFCNQMVYKDNTRYIQSDNTIVHGYCMERFLSSDRTADIKLPLQVVHPTDCFGLWTCQEKVDIKIRSIKHFAFQTVWGKAN